MNHLLLIDASGFVHRAYHAGAKRYRSDGLPTWAIEGFLGLMWRLLGAAAADAPTHVAAVFDAPGKTFRHDLFCGYKTNRPARAAELSAQMPFMRHAAEAMGMAQIERKGYEADDLLATLAARAGKAGMRVTIVSSDKDMLQLVVAGAVEIVDPVAHARLTEADVRSSRKFGVAPARVPEVQALAGDAVDNIPGIAGIGLKTAAALIRNFQDVEGVVKAARGRSPILSAAQRRVLKDALPDLQLYRKLATLRRNVPLRLDLETLRVRPIERAHLDDFLKVLEASGRIESILGLDPQLARAVEPDPLPLAWWRRELEKPGQQPPDEPQAGFYKRRLVRGGPWVGARIWREPEIDFVTEKPGGRDILQCEVGDRRSDPLAEWPRLCSHPIPEAEYRHRTATAKWTKDYAPHEPEARPDQPINWNRVPL